MSVVGCAGETFVEALALRPALQEKYITFLKAIESTESVPQRVFVLCRARIAQIHGQDTQGVTTDEKKILKSQRHEMLGSDAKIALVIAEKIPFQHHLIDDVEVETAKVAFGEDGCVSLLSALAFFDVTCRLNAAISGDAN